MVTVVFFIGCATHVHTVGDGPTSNKEVQTKQWYLIYGLYPLNDVDTQKMADGAESYEIKTQTTFMDGLISAFWGGIYYLQELLQLLNDNLINISRSYIF